jgi:hypothetical protein
MIISHRHKFIFIKPLKVAGTSLEIALSKYCGSDDILTPFGQHDEEKRRELGFTPGQNHLVPFGQQNVKDWVRLVLRARRRRQFYSHEPAANIRKVLRRKIWNSYLKISVVRNPFDYAVSRYFWEEARRSRNANLGPLPSFADLLTDQPELLLENRRITHIEGDCAADVMIRYEHFADDLADLSTRLDLSGNLADDLASISAKTSSRPKNTSPQAMFADHPDCKRLIEILCADDIRTYGYHAPA